MSDRDKFQAALARYYKTERDRTEACMVDIIDILAGPDGDEDWHARILDRLIQHYERVDITMSAG